MVIINNIIILASVNEETLQGLRELGAFGLQAPTEYVVLHYAFQIFLI